MTLGTIRVYVTLVILLTLSSEDATSKPTGPEPAPTVADYQQIRDGYSAAREERCDDVMALLPPAAESDVFWGFPEFVRRGTLEKITECAAKLEMFDVVITYLYQLIDMPDEDTPYRLRWLMWAATRADKPDVAVDALQRLARIASDEVHRLELDQLTKTYTDIGRQDRGDELRYAFLRALYESRYSPPNLFENADMFMLSYARMAADRGDTDGLKDIVLGLTEPGYIFQVRIDRRFDVIRQDGSLESFLDLEAAAERDIVRLGRLVDKHPTMLRGYVEYSEAYQAAGRHKEALAVIEPIALRVRAPGGRDQFVDADTAENWALERYAFALSRLRYSEQSDAMHAESAGISESTLENVSQRLNYASGLLDSGKFAEVLVTTAEMEHVRTSAYGRMWVHTLKVCAITMGDSGRDYSDSLTYLIDHERDNSRALIQTYLCMNDLSAAASALIRRLQSPEQRISALTSLQHLKREKSVDDDVAPDLLSHADSDGLDTGQILRHRFDALRDRRDVREAANAVGRIEEVSLDSSAWIRF